jgi:hypothetical protein
VAGPKKRTAWLDCFTKLTNREVRALYRAGFTAVQLEIVLYLLTQTRGTGKIMSGEVSRDVDELNGAPFDVWQEALANYGRDAAALYRSTIGRGIWRHDKLVARELRRLIAAGVVVEHEAGHKGKPAVLSVDLDATHWRTTALHARRRARRKPVENSAAAAGNGNLSAPDNGNLSAPECGGNGNLSAPLFKRRKRETLSPCSCEHETPDAQAHPAVCAHKNLSTPELQAFACRLCSEDCAARVSEVTA